MDKEQLDNLVAKFDAKIGDSNVELKNEIDTLIDGVKEASATSIKEAKELNAKLEERISELEVAETKAAKELESKSLSFKDAVAKAINDNAQGIKDVQERGAGFHSFDVKAVGTISSSNISGGDIPQAQRIAGFDTLPSRRVRLFELASQASTSADKVEWAYQSGKEGAAGQTGEGLAKNQIDFNWVVGSESMKKTTAYIKVTDEMLAKGSIVAQEINNELLREVSKALESGSYDGDGTGNNLNGIYTVASAFAAGSFALAVDNANQIDVLAVAMNQIRVAQEMDATPTHILMHPDDVTALKLVKLSATDKRYVGRLLVSGMDMSVDGIPIIETTLVTAGEYLIGDFSYATFWTRDSMKIEVGFDADDFTKNLRTIRCEVRGAMVVKTNKRSAFVKGVFATDQAALETA